MGKEVDRADLFCKVGSKDAVYHVQLVETDGGYAVKYQNGRAGGTLTNGSKTGDSPVSLEVARKAFDKVVKEKMKASPPYLPMGEVGGAFTEVSAELAERSTGLIPQLLNDIDEEGGQLEQLIRDPAWTCQQKFDDERRMTRIAVPGEKAIGSNRKGMQVPLPVSIAQSMNGVVCTLDGEIVGDMLFAFDVLQHNGIDLMGHSYEERKRRLDSLAEKFGESIVVVRDMRTEAEKRAFIARTKAMGQEGVVFKLLSAPYTPGRPSSGGPQLKAKNWKDCTVICLGANEDRRSVRAGVVKMTDGVEEVVEVGSVTIPANKAVPATGALFDCKYLYAYEQGSLFQPQFKRVRTDLDRADASITRLQYKRPNQIVTLDDERLAA